MNKGKKLFNGEENILNNHNLFFMYFKKIAKQNPLAPGHLKKFRFSLFTIPVSYEREMILRIKNFVLVMIPTYHWAYVKMLRDWYWLKKCTLFHDSQEIVGVSH